MLSLQLRRCYRALGAMIFSTALAVAQDPSRIAQQASEEMQVRNYSQAELLYAQLAHLAPKIPEVYSNLGLARYDQKKYKAAREAFVSALQLNPNLFVPNFFLAKIDSENGRYAEALPVAEKGVKAQPENRDARRLLASVLVGLERDDQAISEYQKLLEKDPRDVDSLYDLALVYLDLGKSAYEQLPKYKGTGFVELVAAQHDVQREGFQAAASEEYRRAITASPTVPGIRVAFGNLLLRSGNLRLAEEAFQEEMRIDPFSYDAQLGLARVSLHQQKCGAAVHKLDEAVAIRPEFFDPLPDVFSGFPTADIGTACVALTKLASENDSFGTVLLRGELLEAQGQSDSAAAWRVQAERRRDELIQNYRAQVGGVSLAAQSATNRKSLGVKYLQHKRYVEGLTILTPLLASGSADPRVDMLAARALMALARYADLLKLLSRVHVDDAESYFLRGASCQRLALQLIDRIDETEPQSARSHELRASALVAQQMLPEAVREYETAIKLDPDNARLYFDFGNTHFKQREFTEAEAAYAEACRLKPLFSEAYAMRGYALVELNRPEEGVPELRQALRLNPDLMSIHAVLGKALAGSGHVAEAVEELEMVKGTDTDGGLHYQLFTLYRKLGNSEKAKQSLAESERIRKERRQAMEKDAALPVPSANEVESNN